jgi:ribokinase
MTQIEVVGLGAMNMDYLYRVERILNDGEAVVKGFTKTPGGSAANTVFGLARLGVKAGFLGIVGNDEDGKLLLKDFKQADIDTSQIKVKSGSKTGIVLCLTDSLGKRSLYVLPGVNSQLTLDSLNIDYVNKIKLLHVASFADEAQFKLTLELVNHLAPSVKLSFSPGALYVRKGLKVLTPIIKRAHILFINRSEIEQLTGKDVTTGAEDCLNQGSRIVVVTLGKGTNIKTSKVAHRRAKVIAYIRDAGNEFLIEPPGENEETVDTTGAGDAFATGFIYGLLQNKNMETCGQLGNIVARSSIMKLGAREGLPILNELVKRYRQLYKKAI